MSKIVKVKYSRTHKIRPAKARTRRQHDPARIAKQAAQASQGLSVLFNGAGQFLDALADFFGDRR